MSALRLVLAAGIAVITIIAVASGQRDANVLLLVTVHWLISFTALGVNVLRRRHLSSLVDKVKGVAPVVSTGLVEAPSVKLAPLITRIRELGFEVAGSTDTTVTPPAIQTWILVEPSGDTWVESGIAGGPIAVFVSDTAAGRFIETAYPSGEPIDDPRLLSQVVGSSVEAALTAHREAVAAAGGAVRRVTTMDDYLAAEADHRERTGGMRIRNHIDRVIAPSIRDWSISVLVDLACLGALLFLPLDNA